MRNLCIVILLLVLNTARSADLHIRESATGDNTGVDWINARTNLPIGKYMTRPTTYWIADGRYSASNCATIIAGTDPIRFIKATPAAHGSNTGWSDSYGSGQAVIEGNISYNIGTNLVVDGVVGNHGDTNSFGFKFIPRLGVWSKLSQWKGNNIEIRNVLFHGQGGLGPNGSDGQDLAYINFANNVTVSNCYLYNSGRTLFLWRNVSNVVVENCYMSKNESNPLEHSEAISALNSTNCIFRNNTMTDISGTGGLMFGQGSTGWQIYGNTFRNIVGGNTVAGGWTVEFAENFSFHNNTIIDSMGRIGFINDREISTQNNIFINPVNKVDFFGSNHTTVANSFSAGASISQSVITRDPQIDTNLDVSFFDSAKNFYPKKATKPGVSLGATLVVDRTGKQRGVDGTWDRGAFEFAPPGKPSKLKVQAP